MTKLQAVNHQRREAVRRSCSHTKLITHANVEKFWA